MRRLIPVAFVAMTLFVPASASAAQRQNYQPCKTALERAFVFYTTTYWAPRANNEAIPSIDAFNPFNNVWGEGAQEMCSYVKALYGLFPNDGLDWSDITTLPFTIGDIYCRPLSQETKDFLYPFIHANDMQLRALYHPPIVDLERAS